MRSYHSVIVLVVTVLIVTIPFMYIFRCVVRIAGNVMMSFPAGVVKVFTENPSPAMLSFRIKNISKLELITPNSELIVQ